jgi:MFS family permease
MSDNTYDFKPAVPPPLPPDGATPPPPLAYASRPVRQQSGAWAEGNLLVTTTSCALPQDCVYCGAPAEKILNRKYYWHPSWVFILILPGLLIYAIVALVLRKKADVQLGLCPQHAAARTKKLLVAWGIAGLGLGIIVLSIAMMNDALGREWRDFGGLGIVLAIITFIVAAVVGGGAAGVLKPKKITDTHAWFGGAGREFLAKLPRA